MSIISKLIGFVFLLINIFLLTGCTDSNVPLQREVWSEQPPQPITIALDQNVKGDFYMYGGGLIDIGIVKAETKQFVTYLNNYDSSSFNAIQDDFFEKLKKRGFVANKYENIIEKKRLPNLPGSNPNKYEKTDFRSLAVKLKNNRLLLISINNVGASRRYYGFIPLEAPKAICEAEGRLIDLNDNKILWRYTTQQTIPVKGKWDQPPDYPNFTHALNQAVAQARQALVNNFFISVAVPTKADLKENNK